MTRAGLEISFVHRQVVSRAPRIRACSDGRLKHPEVAALGVRFERRLVLPILIEWNTQ